MEIGITKSLAKRDGHLIVLALAVLIGIMLQACADQDMLKESALPDSHYSLEYIESLAIEHPQTALALTDTAEKRGILTPFQVEHLRCIVYHNGLSNFKRAQRHALRAYNMPLARSNSKAFLYLVNLIACEYYKNGDYPNSVRFCTEGLFMARNNKNEMAEAYFNVILGQVLMKMRQQERAFKRFNMAMGMLKKEARKNPRFSNINCYIIAISTTIDAYTSERRYQEAMNLEPEYRDAIYRLTKIPDTPLGAVDRRLANGYAAFAHIYAKMGLENKAKEMYRLLDSTQFAHTDGGHQLRIPYLIASKRFAEALYHQQQAKKFWKTNADTISYDYLEQQLMQERDIYKGLNNYREVNYITDQILAIGDSLRQRERKEDALELAGLYKAKEQAMNTQRMAMSFKHRNVIMSLVSVVLIVGMLYILRMAIYNRLIRKKNTSMADTIEELMDYKSAYLNQNNEIQVLQTQIQELKLKLCRMQEEAKEANKPETLPPVPHEKGENSTDVEQEQTAQQDAAPLPSRLNERDHKLFERVHQAIITRQLYLKPDYTKKDLIKEFHIPNNKFSSLFRECAGCSFNQYIQNCRLDHAVHLMNQHTKWSLESIATEAQMSKSAFYDQFQRKYGMKPSEFREKEANKLIASTPPPRKNLILKELSPQE